MTTEAENTFFRCYAAIEQMTIYEVQERLLSLGRWPKDRVAVRVLDWEEAVTRLSDDANAMMAMCRMVVAIEDPHGTLYLVKVSDLVSGIPDVHKFVRQEQAVQRAVDVAFRR